MIEYMEAITWGMIGWSMRVVYTYYKHSKEVEAKPRGKFKWHSFREKYDQDWVMGFVAMVGLALISDFLWEAWLSNMITDSNTPYDVRVNVLIGYSSIYIIEKISSK